MEEEAPSITKNEITRKMQRIKNNKAPGTERVHGDMLKLLEDR